MIQDRRDPAHAHHDAVMSWLQDREMKDRKLADARRGMGGPVAISAAIERMQVQAYRAFPNIDTSAIDGFVQTYVRARP